MKSVTNRIHSKVLWSMNLSVARKAEMVARKLEWSDHPFVRQHFSWQTDSARLQQL